MASQPNQPKQDPNQDPEQDSKLLQTVGQLFNLTVFLSFFVVALLAYVVVFTQPKPWMTEWWARVTAPEPEATVTEATPAAPAVAYWTATESGDTRLVNRQGEVFTASSDARMPALSGPQGSAAVLLATHERYSKMLQPTGLTLEGLMLSARDAWQLKLDNGVLVVLGREQERAPLDARLARFVTAWPSVQESIGLQIAVADLRYPGGFALTPIDAVPVVRNQASKGKK